jgi:hypothetical protein
MCEGKAKENNEHREKASETAVAGLLKKNDCYSGVSVRPPAVEEEGRVLCVNE